MVEIPYVTGAEDFAILGRRVPACFFFVGITPAGQNAAKAPSNHSPLYLRRRRRPDVGLRAMLGVTVDYLQGPRH